MKISIGTDHAGYQYKEKIKSFLRALGHEVQDFGTYSEEPVDYPSFIRPTALAVASGRVNRGIVLGGSGNGEAMTANRIQGVRCALCWNIETARLARKHNDANMLSLGARMLPLEQAFVILEAWLDTSFDGGRHLRRIQQIDQGEIPQPHKTLPLRNTGTRIQEENVPPLSPPEYDVLIAFRFIKYIEGKNFLELRVDPGLKTPTVIHVPSSERWKSEMPLWAKDRRDEIIGRVKAKCSHMTCQWRTY